MLFRSIMGQGIDSWYCKNMEAYGPVPSYVTQFPIKSDHHAGTNIATGIVPLVLDLHHKSPLLMEGSILAGWILLILIVILVVIIVYKLLRKVGRKIKSNVGK